MSEAPALAAAGPRRDLLLLFAACAVLFGAGLGAHDLWNPNEPIYGEAVREMSARGTWSVPYVNGFVFGEKPILYYWLALVSCRALGGVSELSLRLPSLVAGMVLVGGVYVLVLPYAGRKMALFASAATLTSYQVWWVARTIQMDVFVAATTLWVILPVSRVWDHGGNPRTGWAAAGAVAGLGFLAKGPVAWICPGLALASYALVTRRSQELRRAPILLGAAVCVVVAAPWFLNLWLAGHADVLYEVLIRQNFHRFSDPWDHAAPFWYYLPYFFIDMAPWSFFALIAWKLPGRDENRRRLAWLAAVWIVAIVGFFSLSKSKRDPYIVPAAPAAAVLAAEVMVAFVESRLSPVRRGIVMATAWILAALLAMGGIVLVTRIAPKYPEALTAARGLAATAILCGAVIAVGAWCARTERRSLLPGALTGATAALYLVAAVAVLPALDDFKSARPLCEQISEVLEPNDRVASYNFWKWRSEYRYYLGRPIENLDGESTLRDVWGSSERVVLLVESAQLADARRVIGQRAPEFVRRVGSQKTYVFTNR